MPEAGDLFSLPVGPDEVAFGRVMLNIQTQCIDAGKLKPGSALASYSDIVLVEIYRQTSSGALPEQRDVLIPGILTGNGFLKSGMWEVVGRQDVDPRDVAFPEGLSIETVTRASLIRGELQLGMDMTSEEVGRINIYPGTRPGWIFGELVLYGLDRKEEISIPGMTDVDQMNPARYDLRFSEHRARVYALLGEDPDEPYYALAKRNGYDLARFYARDDDEGA